MWRCFHTAPGHAPFTAKPCQVNLDERNTRDDKWSRLSASFNFDKEDRAPDGLFNAVLWRAVKGPDSVCPAPVHAAFVRCTAGD
jgi:hypothetical protein